MGKKEKRDAIISVYEQADTDSTILLEYLATVSNPKDLENAKLPSLVEELQDKDSEASKKYIAAASILSGATTAFISASISRGAMAAGRTATLGGAATLSSLTGSALAGESVAIGGGMALGGLMLPGFAALIIPSIIGGVAGGVISKSLKNSKLKKYIKEHKEDFKQKKEQLLQYKEKLIVWFDELQVQLTELSDKMQKEVNLKFIEYKDKTKQLAHDISVLVDDCMNADTNKRILQYNEVILNQYKLQKKLEENVDFLFDEYNNLISQRQALTQQIDCLVKLLTALRCPESVINNALNAREEKKK